MVLTWVVLEQVMGSKAPEDSCEIEDEPERQTKEGGHLYREGGRLCS
ncbi:unnamed protein product [Victoria cruziana]